jgi:hypothetical protein
MPRLCMNICLGSSVVRRNSDSGHVGLQEDFQYVWGWCDVDVNYKGAAAQLEPGKLKQSR